MLVNKSFLIPSCDDVELGLKRKSLLEYRISYDETKPIRAIFVIVGGFGSSTDTRMLDYTRRQFASRFSVLAMNVFYHGFCCRMRRLIALNIALKKKMWKMSKKCLKN